MSSSFQESVALITGGAQGIGRAICDQFAQAGATVGILDIKADNAERAAQAIRDRGGKAVACGGNVAERATFEMARGSRCRSRPEKTGTMSASPLKSLPVDEPMSTVAMMPPALETTGARAGGKYGFPRVIERKPLEFPAQVRVARVRLA